MAPRCPPFQREPGSPWPSENLGALGVVFILREVVAGVKYESPQRHAISSRHKARLGPPSALPRLKMQVRRSGSRQDFRHFCDLFETLDEFRYPKIEH
ncbi:MAG: hypothetical protein KF851_09745 [Pirellulaceae bacterium]|nr:hypothetical protein [Pirellulaceae bacterium]